MLSFSKMLWLSVGFSGLLLFQTAETGALWAVDDVTPKGVVAKKSPALHPPDSSSSGAAASQSKLVTASAGRPVAASSVARINSVVAKPAGFSQGAAPVASTKTGEAPAKNVQEDYKIESGDRIRIKIYPEDEYIRGSEMQVGSDGFITLPLVGKVAVGGKTIREAEKNMAALIDADYLVNPSVVVEVMESAKKLIKSLVIVLGQVRKPGTYEVPEDKDHLTLLEVISMAGGFSEIANVKKIKIIRKQNGQKDVISANAELIISGDEPDVDLQSGDVVNVAESLF